MENVQEVAKNHVIFGPPGTGKTKTLVDIARYYADRKRPVTFLSFTRAAAAEALARVHPESPIFPSTIHSLAFQTLGLSSQQVMDYKKLDTLSDITGVPFKRKADDDPEEGDEYLAVLQYANARLMTHEEAYDVQGRPGSHPRFEMFRQAYADFKKTYGFLDFDDMLLMLKESGRIRNALKTPILMLDEAQDCSPLQWVIFNQLADKAEMVFIAGDDDQSIFEWSGADPHGMAAFSEKGSKVKILDQSYRVPKTVHKYVHSMILEKMQNRVQKEFKYRDEVGTMLHYGNIHDVDIKLRAANPLMILVRDRFRALEAQKILHFEHIPYMANGVRSPWQTEWAHAARGILKINTGMPLDKEEIKALSAKAPDKTSTDMMGKDWRTVLRGMPADYRYFFESVPQEVLMADPIVTLSTIHQAKGRECDTVIVNLELTDRAIEQATTNPDAEYRVMYVAMTRAKERLILCSSNPLIYND